MMTGLRSEEVDWSDMVTMWKEFVLSCRERWCQGGAAVRWLTSLRKKSKFKYESGWVLFAVAYLRVPM